MTTQSFIGASYEVLSAETAVSETVVSVHYETLGTGAPTQAVVSDHVETLMKAGFTEILVGYYIEVMSPYSPPPVRKIRTGFLSARIRGA